MVLIDEMQVLTLFVVIASLLEVSEGCADIRVSMTVGVVDTMLFVVDEY